MKMKFAILLGVFSLFFVENENMEKIIGIDIDNNSVED
jgi:hypothetical protein